MLKLSSPFTCLSVVLNVDINTKNKLSQDWRRFASYSRGSSEMDVGVSKSHVFLNYSPRALFSSETRIGMVVLCAPRPCVVPILSIVGLPPVHSVSVCEW